MRKIVMIILVLACIGLVAALEAGGAPADGRETIEKAVLQAYGRINATGPDVDAFVSNIVDFDNGMIIQDGVLFKTRQEAYAALKEGFAGVANVERRQEQTYVTVLSPQYALLSGTGRTKVSLEDGRTFESPFAVSMIFQMREGTWKVLQGHFSIPNR